MNSPRRTPLAYVRRAAKLSRQFGVISPGQVAYQICRSAEASTLTWEVELALHRSGKFVRVPGLFGGKLQLFRLKEIGDVG